MSKRSNRSSKLGNHLSFEILRKTKTFAKQINLIHFNFKTEDRNIKYD